VRVGVSPAVGHAVREEVARVLRDGAPELSIAFREVRPGEIVQRLRDRELDVVLARTAPDAAEIDSASLRPSPAELFVPPGHRLAGASTARLADLDGERLLTWSPPGTPYTDLLVTRLAAAGARVDLVEARVTGATQPPELAETGAVAIVPSGWPSAEGSVRVEIQDDVSLPLLVLWPAGVPSPAAHRLRDRMSSTG
jgi:hypothetical protein